MTLIQQEMSPKNSHVRMQKRGSLAIFLADLPLLLLLLQVLLALLRDLLGARDLWALQKVVA